MFFTLIDYALRLNVYNIQTTHVHTEGFFLFFRCKISFSKDISIRSLFDSSIVRELRTKILTERNIFGELFPKKSVSKAFCIVVILHFSFSCDLIDGQQFISEQIVLSTLVYGCDNRIYRKRCIYYDLYEEGINSKYFKCWINPKTELICKRI